MRSFIYHHNGCRRDVYSDWEREQRPSEKPLLFTHTHTAEAHCNTHMPKSTSEEQVLFTGPNYSHPHTYETKKHSNPPYEYTTNVLQTEYHCLQTYIFIFSSCTSSSVFIIPNVRMLFFSVPSAAVRETCWIKKDHRMIFVHFLVWMEKNKSKPTCNDSPMSLKSLPSRMQPLRKI